MLFWVELEESVLIWEFEHDKKGKNLFRSLPLMVELDETPAMLPLGFFLSGESK